MKRQVCKILKRFLKNSIFFVKMRTEVSYGSYIHDITSQVLDVNFAYGILPSYQQHSVLYF